MTGHKDLCERLNVLGQAVADRNWGEFSMRVPAEPNRDADLVISRAAQVIREQAARSPEKWLHNSRPQAARYLTKHAPRERK